MLAMTMGRIVQEGAGLFAKSNFKGMEMATCVGGCIGVLKGNFPPTLFEWSAQV